MYLGCVRDSAVLSLFAAGECPCCRGVARAGALCPGPHRRPNCHLLEIIEICVLKFVLHCTCMKCSSVFRTTVVKVIVDNAPPTRRTCLLPLGKTKPLVPDQGVMPCRDVTAGDWVWHGRHVAGLWPGASGVAETLRHGQPPVTCLQNSLSCPGQTSRPGAAAAAECGAVRCGGGRNSVWL